MNHEHPSRDSEGLQPPLDAVVQAVLAEPLPEDAIERVKTRARQLGKTSTMPSSRMHGSQKRRWRGSRLLLGGLTLAAALLVMATGTSLMRGRSGGQAFAQMIERVKAAGSVCFTTAAVRPAPRNRRQDVPRREPTASGTV